MNKKEVALLFKKIDAYYPNRIKMDDPRLLVETWYEALKESDCDLVNRKLTLYVKENKFPPTVSDLVAGTKAIKPTKTKEQLEHEQLIKQMQGDRI